MQCPLCKAEMEMDSRSIMMEGIRGYVDRMYCTSRHCSCTVVLEVRDNDNLHNLAMGLTEDGEEIP